MQRTGISPSSQTLNPNYSSQSTPSLEDITSGECLIISQDIFQEKKKKDLILENCPGIIGLVDDMIVFGKTKIEHDKKLHCLMKKMDRLHFNSDKCVVN